VELKLSCTIVGCPVVCGLFWFCFSIIFYHFTLEIANCLKSISFLIIPLAVVTVVVDKRTRTGEEGSIYMHKPETKCTLEMPLNVNVSHANLLY
jgi:hypothetical protein